jgi:hypothetical protein
VDAGGVVCQACAAGADLPHVDAGSLAVVRRLRSLSWEEATGSPQGRAEHELRELLERQVGGLIGQPTRTSRFVREVARFSPTLPLKGR